MPRSALFPLRALTSALLFAGAAGYAAAQVSDGEVRIGVLTDLSGV